MAGKTSGRRLGAMTHALNMPRLQAKARAVNLLTGADRFVVMDGGKPVHFQKPITNRELDAQMGRQGSKAAKKGKGKG